MQRGSLIRKHYRERLKVEDPKSYHRLFIQPGRRYYKKNKAKVLAKQKEWAKHEIQAVPINTATGDCE